MPADSSRSRRRRTSVSTARSNSSSDVFITANRLSKSKRRPSTAATSSVGRASAGTCASRARTDARSASGRGSSPAASPAISPARSACSIDVRKNALPSVSRCRRAASSAPPWPASSSFVSASRSLASGTCRACGSRRKLATRSAKRARLSSSSSRYAYSRQHGQARRLAREVVEKLRARVVGPLQIVDDHEELPRGREHLEQLSDRAEEARLACLGKIGREHAAPSRAAPHPARAPRSPRARRAAACAAPRSVRARAPASRRRSRADTASPTRSRNNSSRASPFRVSAPDARARARAGSCRLRARPRRAPRDRCLRRDP